MTTTRHTAHTRALRTTLALAALQLGSAAHAIDIPTSTDGLSIKWDNTLKYSAAWRLESQSPLLTQPAANTNNSNLDDGDRNFDKGLISNRIDLLSELDVAYKGFGLRVTGAAWYDDVYNKPNDNPGFAGGAFPNQVSVPFNRFVDKTRKVHGRGAEFLDAFVYGAADLGSQRVSARLGRHGMVWGETFFFGANGIAGGMMPVDVVKLVSVPNTQFKEAIRPVPMLSANFQATPDIAIGAYYQFRWAASRIPTVGSYFSPADTTPDGAEQLLLPRPPFPAHAPRLGDVKPKNSGQGGMQLRVRVDQTDLGAYLIRYHEKTPSQIISSGTTGPRSYRLVYPESITAFGLSASHTFGEVNLATEVSVRHDQPLNSAFSRDISAITGGPATDNRDNPGYPVARTAHVNLSAIWSISPNPLFREGSLAAEIGWNRILSVTQNAALLNPSATRDAVAVRALLQTQHRQVVAGVDLAPRLGIGWAPKGSRSAITTTGLPQNGNGDITLGLDATYQDAWRIGIAATHYFGETGSFLTPVTGGNTISYRQYYGDRDFIAISVRRSF